MRSSAWSAKNMKPSMPTDDLKFDDSTYAIECAEREANEREMAERAQAKKRADAENQPSRQP